MTWRASGPLARVGDEWNKSDRLIEISGRAEFGNSSEQPNGAMSTRSITFAAIDETSIKLENTSNGKSAATARDGRARESRNVALVTAKGTPFDPARPLAPD